MNRTRTRFTIRATGNGTYTRRGRGTILCGHAHPTCAGLYCTDVPHHYGVHDHGRHWWGNDTYPVGAGVCPEDHCALYGGHPGACHLRPRPAHEDVECPF